MVRVAAAVVASLLLASPVCVQSGPPSEDRPPARDIPSFASLFRDLGNDLRTLPLRETGLILGSAAVMSLVVFTQDFAITRQASGSARLDIAFEAGELAGGAMVQAGAAFAILAAGDLARSPRVAAAGSDLVRGQILTAMLTQSIKRSVGRMRPDGGRFSFPSGHASSSFATAAVLQRHFGWKAGAPAYAMAAYIGGSRLQENKHFLSDVAFGAAIGIVAGRTVTIGRGKSRLSVHPLATPGGRGIGVTWQTLQ